MSKCHKVNALKKNKVNGPRKNTIYQSGIWSTRCTCMTEKLKKKYKHENKNVNIHERLDKQVEERAAHNLKIIKTTFIARQKE